MAEKDFFTVYFFRKVADPVIKIATKMPITPNQVTVLGFIFLVPPILYFISQGTYLGSWIAIALITIQCVLDVVDGGLARAKEMCSYIGGWLDGFLDHVFQLGIMIAFGIAAVRTTGDTQWYVWTLIMISSQAVANRLGDLYQIKYGFSPHHGSDEFDGLYSPDERQSPIDAFFKNVITPDALPWSAVLTFRYLALFSLIFNTPCVVISVYTITITIRCICMFYLHVAANMPWQGNRAVQHLRQIMKD